MPRFNIAPTQDAPVVRQRTEPKRERTLQFLRWGLIPSWAEDIKIGARLINARGETVAAKPSFRSAFRKRRCLVPADGFYEWRADGKAKQPYLIARRDGASFAFAGLWERWTPKEKPAEPAFIDSYTIVTTEANTLLKPLHERMPVILAPEHYASWLDPEAAEADLLALLRPAPEELLHYFPVSRRVNAARVDVPELIEPTGPALGAA